VSGVCVLEATSSNFVPEQARVLSMLPIDSPLRAVSSWQGWWQWPNDATGSAAVSQVDIKFRAPLVKDWLRHLVPLPEQRRQRCCQSTRLSDRGERRAFLLTKKKAVCSNFVPGQARVLSMPPIDSPLEQSVLRASGEQRAPPPSQGLGLAHLAPLPEQRRRFFF
jgi:hypothetical protein